MISGNALFRSRQLRYCLSYEICGISLGYATPKNELLPQIPNLGLVSRVANPLALYYMSVHARSDETFSYDICILNRRSIIRSWAKVPTFHRKVCFVNLISILI